MTMEGVTTIRYLTTALFGQPTQNTGNAYVPRQAQFAFRLSF